MTSQPVTNENPRWRGLVRLSWSMFAVFAVWTAVYIVASEPVLTAVFGFTPSAPGDTFYITEWGPWIAVTLVWLVPILAGIVSATVALRRGAGKQAWIPLVIHVALFLFFTIPNVIERIMIL